MVITNDNVKDHNPKVSVIIPAYNVAEFIAETLASIFAQTYADYEVILVNDGSPDTPELERAVAPFKSKIVYLKQKNCGSAAARNAAIRMARGEILAFLDADDVWFPQYLERQIAFLEANNLDMAYSNAFYFGHAETGKRVYMDYSESNGPVTTQSLLAGICNVIISGTVVRKEIVVAAGSFDESEVWWRVPDFEMWFRLAKRGAKISYQRHILLKYRVRPEGLFGDRLMQAEGYLAVLDAIKEKFALTAAEQKIWERRSILSRAMLQVERGKIALSKGDFDVARNYFAQAAPFYSRPKTALLNFALLLSPRAVRLCQAVKTKYSQAEFLTR